MNEVLILVNSSTSLVTNIINAYKGWKGATEMKACIEGLKKQLMTEEENRSLIMEKKRDELRAHHEKLLKAEMNSKEKIAHLRNGLRDKSESIRNDFEKSLNDKNEKIRQCVENIMDVHKENSEKVEAMNLEMNRKLSEVIEQYEKKVGSIDDDLRKTFEAISAIHNDYRERMDTISERHRVEIRMKEKEHAKALKEKDRFLYNILMKCCDIHREIQCIQEKRAEDVIRAALMENGYSLPLQGASAMGSVEYSPTILPLQYDRNFDSTDDSDDDANETNKHSDEVNRT